MADKCASAITENLGLVLITTLRYRLQSHYLLPSVRIVKPDLPRVPSQFYPTMLKLLLTALTASTVAAHGPAAGGTEVRSNPHSVPPLFNASLLHLNHHLSPPLSQRKTERPFSPIFICSSFSSLSHHTNHHHHLPTHAGRHD